MELAHLKHVPIFLIYPISFSTSVIPNLSSMLSIKNTYKANHTENHMVSTKLQINQKISINSFLFIKL